jgi:pimeloyl-ACP methyl ester carboxylesterase
MRAIVVAIHGILTRQTDPSWPDRLDAWLFAKDPQVRVLKKEYAAGPWPLWNCLVKDRGLAAGLANELELFVKSGGDDLPPIWVVAHSNGAVIALLTMKRLIAHGAWVGGFIFAGAACQADVNRTGVAEWLRAGQLGCAVAFCSPQDRVLAGDAQAEGTFFERCRAWIWGKFLWPYGCLGRTGWRHVPPQETRVATVWFAGGHSAYFEPAQRDNTFQRIYEIIRRPTNAGKRRVSDATAGGDACQTSPANPRRAS